MLTRSVGAHVFEDISTTRNFLGNPLPSDCRGVSGEGFWRFSAAFNVKSRIFKHSPRVQKKMHDLVGLQIIALKLKEK